MTGPTTITSWQGWTLALNAPSPQGKDELPLLVGRRRAVAPDRHAGERDHLHGAVQAREGLADYVTDCHELTAVRSSVRVGAKRSRKRRSWLTATTVPS